MESLKLLQELEVASTKLKISFLTHMFRDFSPSTSANVQQAMNAFHTREQGEMFDFRPAYHQFSDWLFGWNVSETDAAAAAALAASGGGTSLNNSTGLAKAGGGAGGATGRPESGLQFGGADPTNVSPGMLYLVKRVPRDIDLAEPAERVECMRMLETFQTQFSIGLRHLRRACFEMEEKAPLIGKNIVLLTQTDEAVDDRDDELAVWGNYAPKAGADAANGGDGKGAARMAGGNTDDPLSSEIESLLKVVDHSLDARADPPSLSGSRSSLVIEENAKPKRPSLSPPSNRMVSPRVKGRRTSNAPSGGKRASRLPVIDRPGTEGSAPQTPATPEGPPGTEPAKEGIPAADAPVQSGPAKPQTPVLPRPAAAIPNMTEEEIKRQDIDTVFYDVSVTMDLFQACLVSCMVVIAFSEMISDKTLYVKFVSNVHDLCSTFVLSTMRVIWDLLRQSIPDIQPVRDQMSFRNSMQNVLKTRNYKPTDRNFIALSRLPAKLSVVDSIFAGMDVFLFPEYINAHRDGVKCMRPTSFDAEIWITGGYDSKARIWDLRERTCLAQYAGHKSIITDVHFVRGDTYVVTASFDKTIKIWNAQTAVCERTLQGHTDAITSCDVSSDGRLILSGSLDLTVQLWEFASGECVANVRKHTRYVKAVKFSPDLRYAASAGLDRRVYIWDVKIMMYSKNITHVRCIEAHDDYILAIDLARPNLLLTTSRDQNIKLWDYFTGHCISTVSLAPAWACTVVFGPDAELFAAGCFDNSLHIFRTKTGERVRHIKVFNMGIISLRFPKNYDYILCGTQEGFLQKLAL